MQKLSLEKNSKKAAAILRSAEKLFSSQGFPSTSLKDIAKASKANSALVSYYFGNKAGLREAVIENKLAQMNLFLEPLRANKENLNYTHFRKMIEKILSHIKSDDNFHRLALRAHIEDKEFSTYMIKNLWNPLFAEFCDLLNCITERNLEKTELESRCLQIFSFIQYFANLQCFLLPHMQDTQLADEQLIGFENYFLNVTLPDLCKPKASTPFARLIH